MHVFNRARMLANQRLKHHHNGTTPTQDKTLIIIDMQSGFIDIDEEDIIPNICSLICHAKHHDWAIIVVEYNGYGETDKTIQDHLVGYPYWTTVDKGDCDGGQQVIDCINQNPAWSLNIVACGIYGPECVAATVDGILNNSDLAEIDVVTDAIYPEYVSLASTQQEIEVVTNDVINCNPYIPS